MTSLSRQCFLTLYQTTWYTEDIPRHKLGVQLRWAETRNPQSVTFCLVFLTRPILISNSIRFIVWQNGWAWKWASMTTSSNSHRPPLYSVWCLPSQSTYIQSFSIIILVSYCPNHFDIRSVYAINELLSLLSKQSWPLKAFGAGNFHFTYLKQPLSRSRLRYR